MTSFDATSQSFSSAFNPSMSSHNPFAFSCGNQYTQSAGPRTPFKKPSRQMFHTDRGLKLANNQAQHRNQRNLKMLKNRGGTEEFERIIDVMDRRQQDLQQAREAKRYAASLYASTAEEEFEDEDCCSILPVQHAQYIERERLRELEERQREIDAMEAEIEEYSRLAEEEEARMLRDARNTSAMRHEQESVMSTNIREPWDISDEDVEMAD